MRFILLSLLLVAGCNSQDDLPDCTQVACTEEFRVITVSVSDPSGVKIPLDSFQVVAPGAGLDLTPDYTPSDLESFQENNAYPLLTDQESDTFLNKRLQIVFRGYVSGDLLVQETFLAGADCCHVDIYEGDTDIIVD